MPTRPIVQLGDPLLRTRSAPVESVADFTGVLRDMRDTLHEFRRTHGFGRGISAVQIGEPKRIIYIEFEGRAYSLINPVLAWASEEAFLLWDDCFSFPDLLVEVMRSVSVTVTYQDEHGSAQRLEASGAFSELLQHELDHLDGILAVDRAIRTKPAGVLRDGRGSAAGQQKTTLSA